LQLGPRLLDFRLELLEILRVREPGGVKGLQRGPGLPTSANPESSDWPASGSATDGAFHLFLIGSFPFPVRLACVLLLNLEALRQSAQGALVLVAHFVDVLPVRLFLLFERLEQLPQGFDLLLAQLLGVRLGRGRLLAEAPAPTATGASARAATATPPRRESENVRAESWPISF